MDHSWYLCHVLVMLLCASVYCCLVVTCWERADLLALVCDVLLWVYYFLIGILGQVWYLIASITDPCPLSYHPNVCNVSLQTNNLINLTMMNKGKWLTTHK